MKKVIIERANRLYQLPPEIFSFMKTEKAPSLIKRTELIDLGSFCWPQHFEDPDLRQVDIFTPASDERIDNLKEELAGWFSNYHGVRVNSRKEIFIGGSITSLLFQLALAFIDNGDIAFVPDIGLPVYRKVTSACGGEPISYQVSLKNNWQPDFEKLNSRLGRVACLLFLNNPHNPTGVILGEKDLEELLWLTGRENIIIVNDAAYQSLDGRKVTSLISIPGGKKGGVEVYSFSYMYGLPAMPFGFVVGNRDVISGLKQSASLIPQRIPDYFIDMAVTAIRQFPSNTLEKIRKDLRKSSIAANQLLDTLAFEKASIDTVPYVWAKVEKRIQSANMARTYYRRYRILCAPGYVFGDNGEGFVRFSLTADSEKYEKAISRIKRKKRLVKRVKEK